MNIGVEVSLARTAAAANWDTNKREREEAVK
jgi:hypothetical protein